jgi:hypothetical protein
MKILALVLMVSIFEGCGSQYRVYLHDKETKTNHYLLVERKYGDDRCYDCYSRPDSINWKPTCKELKFFEEK